MGKQQTHKTKNRKRAQCQPHRSSRRGRPTPARPTSRLARTSIPHPHLDLPDRPPLQTGPGGRLEETGADSEGHDVGSPVLVLIAPLVLTTAHHHHIATAATLLVRLRTSSCVGEGWEARGEWWVAGGGWRVARGAWGVGRGGGRWLCVEWRPWRRESVCSSRETTSYFFRFY